MSPAILRKVLIGIVDLACSVTFLIQGKLEGFMFNPALPQGLSAQTNDGAFKISIKPCDPDNDEFGHRLGVNLRATLETAVDEGTERFVSRFIEGYVDHPDLKGPRTYQGKPIINSDGSLQKGEPFAFHWLPLDILDLANSSLIRLLNETRSFLENIRWTQNEPLVIDFRTIAFPYWRTGGDGLFHVMPRTNHRSRFKSTGGFRWTELDQENQLSMWRRDSTQVSLAHELRFEAEHVSQYALRSAYLLAASALEVGIKLHLSKVVDRSEWLLMNMPSPPIFKVLRDYLPIVHAANPRNIDWSILKSHNKTAQALFEKRNALAHRGAEIVSDDLSDALDCVSDFLYIFDYLEGLDWAQTLVSKQLRDAMGWQGPTHERFTIYMSSELGELDH